MSDQQKLPKEYSGLIFPNHKKVKEKQPDYKGKAVVNNEVLHISGWKNQTNDEFRINLSFTSDKDYLEYIEKNKQKNDTQDSSPEKETEDKPITMEELYDPEIEELFKDFYP